MKHYNKNFLSFALVILLILQKFNCKIDDKPLTSFMNSFDISKNDFLMNLENTENPSTLHNIDKDLYSNFEIIEKKIKIILENQANKFPGFNSESKFLIFFSFLLYI